MPKIKPSRELPRTGDKIGGLTADHGITWRAWISSMFSGSQLDDFRIAQRGRWYRVERFRRRFWVFGRYGWYGTTTSTGLAQAQSWLQQFMGKRDFTRDRWREAKNIPGQRPLGDARDSLDHGR